MKSILKKSLVGLVGAAALAVPFAGIASADQPVNPGGFGQGRAANIQQNHIVDDAPGASSWGHLASDRAGDNGEMNRAWMETVGATPQH